MSLSPFIKTDGWVRMWYHSNFTVQPQYLNWVRLSRKFICISISSLAGEVWAEATSQCCPPMQCPGWQMVMAWRHTHRRGAYTRVYKGKVMFDYLHTKYDDSGLSLTDVSNLVMNVYHLCRVSNYSNSRVRGYGQLEWPYCSIVRCFQMTYEMKYGFDLTTTGVVIWI